MYIVNLIAIKIPAQFFIHLERTKLNFIKKEKKETRIAKRNLFKKKKGISAGITIPDFKLNYRSVAIQIT